jgi:hypothetical protein
MKITVLKSTVESALAPVLKMVSNAKLPADFHPTPTFQSDKQSLSVGCTSSRTAAVHCPARCSL